MRISDWSSDVCSSDLQEGDDQDERQIVPVGNVDVRLLAPRERAQIKDEIGHPDDDEPDIGIPFRLGIFLRLGDTHEIAGHRKDARSEERRVGNKCFSTCKSRWQQITKKKNNKK